MRHFISVPVVKLKKGVVVFLSVQANLSHPLCSYHSLFSLLHHWSLCFIYFLLFLKVFVA